MNILYVEGAYNRRYFSGAGAVADWKAGKDFKIINGPYCSKRDHFETYGHTAVICVIQSLTKIGPEHVTLWRAGH